MMPDVLEVTVSMTSDDSNNPVIPTMGSNDDISSPTSPAMLMSDVLEVTASTTSDDSTDPEIPAKGTKRRH